MGEEYRIDEFGMFFGPGDFSGEHEGEQQHLRKEQLPNEKNSSKRSESNMCLWCCLEKDAKAAEDGTHSGKNHHDGGDAMKTLLGIFSEDDQTEKDDDDSECQVN